MPSRLLYLVLSLALSAPLFAITIVVDPPAPQVGDPVRIRVSGWWPDGCVPDAVIVTMTQPGRIELFLRAPQDLGCILVPVQFSKEVVLASLPAGTWQVVVYAPLPPLAQRFLGETSFVVASTVPQVDIEPRVIPAGAQTPWISIRAERIAYCPPIVDPCPIPQIRFNGVAVQSIQAVSDDEVLVRAAIAEGTQNIDVHIDSGQLTARLEKVIRVAGATYDPGLYERVLIPVIYNGPGAHGSQWRTGVALHNSARTPITLRARDSLAEGETRPLVTPDSAPAGFFLDVGRFSADVLHVNALVRDISRQAEAIGAEMPVVREHDWRRGKAMLMNVPGSASYRVTVRAYAFDGTPETTLTLPYAIYAMDGSAPLSTGNVRLTASADGPAYGSFEYSHSSGVPLRYEFGPLPEFADPRYWVFASITNNATQHVTIITPQ
ncbi:MAG TPA: hypothetical protein VGF48_17580 [Thermoanaerobaculia bacterium]|jgi:hypothetical protein